MHRMTRDALRPDVDVHAPFDGARFRFKDDTAILDRAHGARRMRIERADGEVETYRVTRVIGGRVREDFAGVDEERGGEEVVLPVSYVLTTGTFRYKGYSVMVHERTGLRAGPAWAQSCIFCHNTVPEIDRLLGPIAGARAPAYQGEQVDLWLPESARAQVRVHDASVFAEALATEMARLGATPASETGTPARLARQAIPIVRARFDAGSLVELGIGCEACHGGGRAHARDPRVLPSWAPAAPWLRVDMPDGPATAQNRVCATCHQVLFSRYPYTWEGGRRDAGAGGSHMNSGEARDFLLGGCARSFACTACHDPHGNEDAAARRALATPAKNGVCTACHAELAAAGQLRAHAHHDPERVGGSCVACHMPRKNMGLDGTLTRYHRIGSATDPERVLGDRPLECAVCHSDRSVASLVDTMEAWWPVRYPRSRLAELYGSLDANVIRATLARGKPHERAVAIALLGEARARDAVPAIARELVGEYPLVREWARRALASILGACDVDLSAKDDVIVEDARRCVGRAKTTGSTAPLAPHPPPPGLSEDPED
jgi:predicted CXXCH cytochrome family protein